MAGWIVRVVLAAGLSVAAASIVHPGIVKVLLALVVVAAVLELAHDLRGRRRRAL